MAPESVSADLRHVTVVSRKTPIALAVITALLALLLAAKPRPGYAHFRFADEGERLSIPDLTVDGMTTAWIAVGVLVVLVLVAVGSGLLTFLVWFFVMDAPLLVALTFAVTAVVFAGMVWTSLRHAARWKKRFEELDRR